MNIGNVMTRTVAKCTPGDSLDHAAKVMWDEDCGCVPVVSDGNRLVGILTDRDICMSALFSGCGLKALTVSDAMSKNVHSCRADDQISEAEALMRTHQIRRLPIVDAEERVVGILSLNDIARAWSTGRWRVSGDDVAQTLAAVCRPRPRGIAA
jgi:CBS domain-containing protein